VLEALLDKYADEGIEHIERSSILSIDPFTKFGTPIEIIRLFGDKTKYTQAINELETALYTTIA
jgi:type I restriction enzyme R subunit